jgi:hypothetical protein
VIPRPRSGAPSPDRPEDEGWDRSHQPREGGRSRFVQSERFSGVLVGLVKGTLTKTETGFEQMNAELKARAEQRAVE